MIFVTLDEAAKALSMGKLVIYPTETFYAIGCNAFNPTALRGIYAAKQRDNSYPLPVIAGNIEQVEQLVGTIPASAYSLIDLFWPGPLTIIMPVGQNVPPLLTAGTGKVAVRITSHPLARALCLEAGTPLVSSSANISRQAPAALLAELSSDLLKSVNGGLLDGTPLPSGGLPSTIIEVNCEDINLPVFRLLREGALPRTEIEKENIILV